MRRMSVKLLFVVTAALEAGTGLVMLMSPPLFAGFLLGSPLDTPVAVLVGRLAGAALLALGAACWLARGDERSGASKGLVVALLLYNVASLALLAYAGAGLGLAGVLLWPASAVHAALALWCVAILKAS